MRIYKETDEQDNEAIRAYGARVLNILEQEPALFPDKRNELDPPPLLLSPEAKLDWQEFHNHVEQQCAGALAPIKDFAVKASEHAARIAGVITITEDLRTKEIGGAAMSNEIDIVDWHIGEASRLQQGGIISQELIQASALLEWIQGQPSGQARFREILQFGPNATRTKDATERAIDILINHG